jgi:hypothetical protein
MVEKNSRKEQGQVLQSSTGRPGSAYGQTPSH